MYITQCENFKNVVSFRFYVEINFGESGSSKTAIFASFVALYFVALVNFSLQKVLKFIKTKFRASECVKMADFALLHSPKLISRKI